MERVGEHPVPAGPWRCGGSLPAAGAPGRRRGDRRGGAPERGHGDVATRRDLGVKLSYHWLDDRGNAIVWDGPRVDFGEPVAPGDEVEVEPACARAAAARPLPAGVRPRRGAALLVRRGRLVAARARRRRQAAIEERRLAAVARGGDDPETAAALRRAGGAARRVGRGRDGVPGRRRDPGARLVAAHPRRARRGFVAVGGSIEARDRSPGLGARRRPQPGLLASAPAPVAPRRARAGRARGLPAYLPDGEPAIFDGRIRLRLPRGRRRG